VRAATILFAVLSVQAFGGIALAADDKTNAEVPQLMCGCPSGLQRGDIAVTTSYQHVKTSRHYFSRGEELDRGTVQSEMMLLSLDYALTDRLIISAGLPYVFSKYTGKQPHAKPIDDGSRHGSAQDYRVDLRYSVMAGEFVVTPTIGFIAPSHNYTYFGHAAAGRHVHEQFAGVNVERRLDELLPGLYVQGRYAFSLAEKVLDVSHNRTNLDLSFGYFVTPKLSVRGLWSAQNTHGGVNLALASPLKGEAFFHHDQNSNADSIMVGAGASYSVNDTVDVFAGVLRSVSGRNIHKTDFAPSVGVTWTLPASRWHARTIDGASCPPK
jgi:hypothetical protein